MDPLEHKLYSKIRVLNEKIWEDRVKNPDIDDWLGNFDVAEDERLYALYLLSNFIYFGSFQTRELLNVIYRDLFKYPIIEKIRKNNGDTTDLDFINREYNTELSATRFLGVGNPSESGAHLLYYFRQENSLPKDLFMHTHEIFTRDKKTSMRAIRIPKLKNLIFIDDFCGSGDQGVTYSEEILKEIKLINDKIKISYFVLMATQKGIDKVKSETLFDKAECVFNLDNSFKAFDEQSRVFMNANPKFNRKTAEHICLKYGSQLLPTDPLGHKDCQLLVGFHHNTPDNTLPIIWGESSTRIKWKPIFKRYHKNYGWGY